MSTPIKNITLKFPCQEKWDQLDVVPGGRLCHSCAHIVKDFRSCSQAQLDSELKTQSHVCGIFNRQQLSATFLKAAAVAIAATSLGACHADAQPAPDSGDVVLEPTEITTMGIVAYTPQPDSTQIRDLPQSP
jgi:hypothetical protein